MLEAGKVPANTQRRQQNNERDVRESESSDNDKRQGRNLREI